MLSREQIFQLVVSGRMFCWAGQGDRHSIEPTIPGAKRFRFETNFDGTPASYEDQYLGETTFQGQEIVRSGPDDEAIWGMVYRGWTMSEVDKVEQVLKWVLRSEVEHVRFGEDIRRESSGLVYQSKTSQRENMLSFTQVETISRDGVMLYRATLCAGPIMTLGL